MAFFRFLFSLAVLLPGILGKEMAVNEQLAQEKYDSGIVHETIMSMKKVSVEFVAIFNVT